MIPVRAAWGEDAAAIAAIYAPYVLSGTQTFETELPDADAIGDRMTAAGDLYPWLVATSVDGAVLGYAYAGKFRERAAYRHVVETTIYVDASAARRGIGRRLYETLLATLRAQGFTQAIGLIALPNAGSVGLHEALGFRHVGTNAAVGYKNGRWIDVGLWQLELNRSTIPPVEPKKVRYKGSGV